MLWNWREPVWATKQIGECQDWRDRYNWGPRFSWLRRRYCSDFPFLRETKAPEDLDSWRIGAEISIENDQWARRREQCRLSIFLVAKRFSWNFSFSVSVLCRFISGFSNCAHVMRFSSSYTPRRQYWRLHFIYELRHVLSILLETFKYNFL